MESSINAISNMIPIPVNIPMLCIKKFQKLSSSSFFSDNSGIYEKKKKRLKINIVNPDLLVQC